MGGGREREVQEGRAVKARKMKGGEQRDRRGQGGRGGGGDLVTVPLFSPSPTHQGPTMPRKQWAEKAAALEAIRILHEAKELDDRLMPVTRRVGEEDEDDEDEGCRGERDAGTQKRSQMYKKEASPLALDDAPSLFTITCPALPTESRDLLFPSPNHPPGLPLL